MSYTLHRPPLTRGRLHPVPGAYFPHASLQIAPVAFCILERRMQYRKPETEQGFFLFIKFIPGKWVRSPLLLP